MEKLYGYVGKIARINLTSGEVSIIPTSNYVPKYIGGRGICNKIFWDEVGPGVKAFDPENKIIFMTVPLPAQVFLPVAELLLPVFLPNVTPEQYTWSGIGGWFGAELKYAGYDGLVIEGKAPEPQLYMDQ